MFCRLWLCQSALLKDVANKQKEGEPFWACAFVQTILVLLFFIEKSLNENDVSKSQFWQMSKIQIYSVCR